MQIQTYTSGPFSTNTYVISCPETGDTAIIDAPPGSADSIIAYCKDKKPTKIIITHSHWDHIADTAILKKHFGCPVYIHPLDAENLRNPGADGLPLMFPIEGVEPDVLLSEGDIVTVGNLQFEVIHTPGHCPGSICLYCKEKGKIFVGDTIFRGSIGNLSLPTANQEAMWKSLPKLARLPSETVVYSGHGPTTTIGNESWLSNPRAYFSY